MTTPADSPQPCREFTLKWDMGARAAGPIATQIRQFDAAIELGRNGLWLDAKTIMNLMLVTGMDGPQIIAVRASGPDADKALAELTRLFDCEAHPPCSCGKPRLINWDSYGAVFVCAKSHSWSVRRT
jgi:phosphotransferase system HPr (HPr) family protein